MLALDNCQPFYHVLGIGLYNGLWPALDLSSHSRYHASSRQEAAAGAVASATSPIRWLITGSLVITRDRLADRLINVLSDLYSAPRHPPSLHYHSHFRKQQPVLHATVLTDHGSRLASRLFSVALSFFVGVTLLLPMIEVSNSDSNNN